jgi:hypothetical protein
MSSSSWIAGAAACVGLLAAGSATAAVDLAAVAVVPLKGQSADRARRDRYECHNWAVEQSGVMPASVAQQQAAERRADRAESARRADRVINGAAAGAAIGGLVRSTQRRKNPANGVLAGAAIGAAIGAATGRDKDDTAAEEPMAEYLRALSACLEGRGYRVEIPGDDENTVAGKAVTAAQ